MKLWLVTVVLKGTNQNVGFTFDTEDSAIKAYEALKRKDFPEVEVTDDYGTTATIQFGDIALVLLMDYHRQLIGQQEVQLEQAASNARTQRRADADPLMRASISGNGRAILSS